MLGTAVPSPAAASGLSPDIYGSTEEQAESSSAPAATVSAEMERAGEGRGGGVWERYSKTQPIITAPFVKLNAIARQREGGIQPLGNRAKMEQKKKKKHPEAKKNTSMMVF